MCGIFFWLNIDENVSIDKLRQLANHNDKRGPETFNDYKDNHVYMAFHRLAINGCDEISNQPLTLENRYMMIGNGEIFNFKELAEEFGVCLQTNSDMEIVLHLYKKFGPEFIHRLNGEFAMVIYDMKERSIMISRDRFGIRPLYHYVNSNGHQVFSSTLLSLPLFHEVNQVSYILSPISQLSPATYTLFSFDDLTSKYIRRETKLYYRYPELHNRIIYYPNKRVYDSLYSAVKCRVLTSDRKIGALLSGGLDSSLVSAMAQRILSEHNLPKLHTFSIGMPESEDLKFSKQVADHIGSVHHQIEMSENDFFKAIPHVIKDIESYDTTTVRASVGNWLIGKYIREHTDIKVVLNGDGSDELMGGYLYFHKSPDADEFDKECKRLLNQIHFFDVLRSDRSISSHGLEARTPFLDVNYVNTFLNLAPNHRFDPNLMRQNGKMTQYIEKYILRKAVDELGNNLLPASVLWRKKEAFSDGVSSQNRSWYEIIQEMIHNQLENNPELASKLAHLKTPQHLDCDTLEKKYYYLHFQMHYPECDNIIPHYWMPKYVDNCSDASARTLDLYNTENRLMVE